jgi:hypothetical protein
MVCP